MGWLITRLGNGFWGVIDESNPDNPPQVTVNGTIQGTFNPQLSANFGRILNEQFNDTEEVRWDLPNPKANGKGYVGVAPLGSPTSNSVWNIIQQTYDANGNKARAQIQLQIAWDNRTQGWG